MFRYVLGRLRTFLDICYVLVRFGHVLGGVFGCFWTFWDVLGRFGQKPKGAKFSQKDPKEAKSSQK